VVVCHNHAETLPACLRAISGLLPPPELVVVVDNGSTDGSAALAARAGGALPLEILSLPTNTGFTGGANRGLGLVESPWVLLLNPDCAPEREYVAQLFGAAASVTSEEQIGALTGKLLRAEGPELVPSRVIDAAGMVVTSSGRHLDRGAGEADDPRFDRPAWVFGGTGAATLYRCEALADVAYAPDEVLAATFFAYREDAELAWRLQWRGWRCLYVPTAVAAHRRGLRPEQGRAGQREINLHSVRNRFLLRLHCADIGWHLRCFPWWMLRDLLVVAACLSVEMSSLSALREVWRGLPDARRRRRWVLGRASVPSGQVSRWFRMREWVEEVVPR